jgi:hypothetical protein
MINEKKYTYNTIADPNANNSLVGVIIFTGIGTVLAVVGTLAVLLVYWLFG